MKKIALVLAVLLVVGGAAFAEVMVGGAATVSGSVSTTIGMDLDSRVWGADASSSVTLKIPFANGSAGASGDDDTYGEISVTDIGVNFDSGAYKAGSADAFADGELTAGTVGKSGLTDADYDGDNFDGNVSAKVVAGDIYVGLNSVGYNNNYAAGTGDYDVNISSDWYDVTKGELAFGFNNGMIGVEVGVGAKSGLIRAGDATANEDFVGPWDGDTASGDATSTTQTGINGVVLSVDAKYMSDMITVPVYVTIDNNFGGDFLLGVSANPSLTVGAFSLTAPVDFVMLGDAKGFDVAPTLTFAVMDGLALTADAYFYNHLDSKYLANLGAKIATDGLVSGLTASVDVDVTDVTADLGWGVDVAVGYVIADGLTVNVAPGYDSTDDIDVAGSVVFGSAFTGIDNTTFTLDYSKAMYDLTTGSAYGDHDAGILSVATKIAF